jgi:hypothetical protein
MKILIKLQQLAALLVSESRLRPDQLEPLVQKLIVKLMKKGLPVVQGFEGHFHLDAQNPIQA